MVAHDEIDDSPLLLLSQRSLIEKMVAKWWMHRTQSIVDTERVIIALDSLGLLDRAKVREAYCKEEAYCKAIEPLVRDW